MAVTPQRPRWARERDDLAPAGPPRQPTPWQEAWHHVRRTKAVLGGIVAIGLFLFGLGTWAPHPEHVGVETIVVVVVGAVLAYLVGSLLARVFLGALLAGLGVAMARHLDGSLALPALVAAGTFLADLLISLIAVASRQGRIKEGRSSMFRHE